MYKVKCTYYSYSEPISLLLLGSMVANWFTVEAGDWDHTCYFLGY